MLQNHKAKVYTVFQKCLKYIAQFPCPVESKSGVFLQKNEKLRTPN